MIEALEVAKWRIQVNTNNYGTDQIDVVRFGCPNCFYNKSSVSDKYKNYPIFARYNMLEGFTH